VMVAVLPAVNLDVLLEVAMVGGVMSAS
jgi:hypothetical protein